MKIKKKEMGAMIVVLDGCNQTSADVKVTSENCPMIDSPHQSKKGAI